MSFWQGVLMKSTVFLALIISQSIFSLNANASQVDPAANLVVNIKKSELGSNKSKCTVLSYFDSYAKYDKALNNARYELKNAALREQAVENLLFDLKNIAIFYENNIKDFMYYVKKARDFIGAKDEKEYDAIQSATDELINALKIIKRSYGLEIQGNLAKVGNLLKSLPIALRKMKGGWFKKQSKDPLLNSLREIVTQRIQEVLNDYNDKVTLFKKTDADAKRIAY